MGVALLMCERCDAPLGSLDERLDSRIYQSERKLAVGDIGDLAAIIGLVALLGLIFVSAVGL